MISEITSDPRQPTRFEKKKNTTASQVDNVTAARSGSRPDGFTLALCIDELGYSLFVGGPQTFPARSRRPFDSRDAWPSRAYPS